MNTATIFDLFFTATLTSLVVVSLVTAGMETALITGALLGGAYMLLN